MRSTAKAGMTTEPPRRIVRRMAAAGPHAPRARLGVLPVAVGRLDHHGLRGRRVLTRERARGWGARVSGEQDPGVPELGEDRGRPQDVSCPPQREADSVAEVARLPERDRPQALDAQLGVGLCVEGAGVVPRVAAAPGVLGVLLLQVRAVAQDDRGQLRGAARRPDRPGEALPHQGGRIRSGRGVRGSGRRRRGLRGRTAASPS